MLTDDEFISAVTKLRANTTSVTLIEIYDKALECVHRPATKAQQIAYKKALAYRSNWGKKNRRKKHAAFSK